MIVLRCEEKIDVCFRIKLSNYICWLKRITLNEFEMFVKTLHIKNKAYLKDAYIFVPAQNPSFQKW